MTTKINRRQFVAATSAVATSTIALGSPIAQAKSSTHPSRSKKLPKPSIALIARDDANHARLVSTGFAIPSIEALTTHVKVSPFTDIEQRVFKDSSINIELYHPTPDTFTHLIQTHNINRGPETIPSFGSPTQAHVHTLTSKRVLLKITQEFNSQTQTSIIKMNALGEYVLAIPTADQSSKSNFRTSTIQTNEQGYHERISSPFPSVSNNCAYFKITLKEYTNGDHHGL